LLGSLHGVERSWSFRGAFVVRCGR
jgi:hypothetical protein